MKAENSVQEVREIFNGIQRFGIQGSGDSIQQVDLINKDGVPQNSGGNPRLPDWR